jgi:EmrB/QacA subfamily drug resistance transporter
MTETSAPPGTGEVTGLDRRRRLVVLAVCCMSLFIVGMDATIVNVALPAIGRDFNASVSGLQWVVDAYLVVLASFLMLSGSTADRFGRRRTFQAGLSLFTLGSLLCSVAPSLQWLIVFRMVQAIGGSMLNPVAMSIIRNVFHDPKERAQAVGVWGATVGVSIAMGPVLGGVLVQAIGWRAIFWVNIPIGLAVIVLAAKFVPESKAPHPRQLDLVGQLLVMAVLFSLTFGIIEGPRAGWLSTEIIALFSITILGITGILFYEPRRHQPLIELRFFRSVPFSGATLVAVSAFAAFSGFLFLNTLYLQDVRGLSALTAGLCTLPMAAMTIIISPLSGWMVGRFGSRPSLLAAGGMLSLASLMLTGLADSTPYAWLMASYFLFGTGFGFVNPPITNTAISGMPPEQAGVAAAIASTSRQIGQSLGVAVVGVAATSGIAHVSLHEGLAQGSHPGWWIIFGCSLLVLVLGFLTTTRWAMATVVAVTAHRPRTEQSVGQPGRALS